jgi:galactokinase
MNISELQNRFEQAFGRKAAFVARAPGRVNLIGEHTDYNDGFVLPMAIDRDVTYVGAPRTDSIVRIHSANFDQTAEFDLRDIQKSSDAEWSNYARGVAQVLQQNGHALTGFDAVLWGDVPIASGLSSSAATEMATIKAFEAASGGKLAVDGVSAARFSQTAERSFVGVNCGIMDQFISSLGRTGQALLIDCRSLEYELVPVPQGASVLVVDTSAPRTLAGSAYNERFAQCQQAAKTFGVASLRDVSPEEFERRRGELSDVVAQRVEHVIYESPRTLDAVQAMKAGDLVRLGQLMNQSHDSLRDLYAVSSFELDTVVNITRAIPGVYGARMTGAGFGGCAIALVRNDAVEAARAAVLADYPRLTNREPKVYVCVASEGASWRTI